jgi:hypothetical protein
MLAFLFLKQSAVSLSEPKAIYLTYSMHCKVRLTVVKKAALVEVNQLWL